MKKQLLLLGMFAASFASFGQEALREGFEGETFPPAGWTTVNTHATNNWVVINDADFVIAGTQSAAVNWIAGAQDESLISPSFSLEGFTTAYFNFTAIVGYDYMVAPNPNGDLFAKISIDGGTTWTELWVEEDEGVFEDYDPRIKHLDISAYAGETDVMIKFQYVANDADLVVIDEVSVTACPGSGITDIVADEITDDSADFTITGTAVSYDIEYGAVGFELGTGLSLNTTTGVFSLTPLEPGTGYEFYIKSNCSETADNGWEGPYIFYTTLSTSVNLDYEYGFEEVPFTAAGWSVVNVGTGGNWTRFTTSEDIPTQEGDWMAGVIGAAAPADTWLFSRGINVTSGDEVSLSFYAKMVALAGAGNVNSLVVTVGTDNTAAAQTTVLLNLNVTDLEWALKNASFTAPDNGVYYFGFHCTSPAHTQADFGALLIDNVAFDSELSIENLISSEFSVYPNPATNVINITNADNILVNGVAIVDINGRTVKSLKFDNVTEAQINVADLSAGVYLMNISSDNGTTTKKIVKN